MTEYKKRYLLLDTNQIVDTRGKEIVCVYGSVSIKNPVTEEWEKVGRLVKDIDAEELVVIVNNLLSSSSNSSNGIKITTMEG